MKCISKYICYIKNIIFFNIERVFIITSNNIYVIYIYMIFYILYIIFLYIIFLM